MNGKNVLKQLYSEFARYYHAERQAWVAARPERRDWAPHNPRRLFNLVVRAIRPAYRNCLSDWHIFSAAYATLGFADGRGFPGLFATFDPSRYHGRLPLADHFVGVFKKRLRARLAKLRYAKTDSGRQGHKGKFQANVGLGLVREQRHAGHRKRTDPGLEEVVVAAVVRSGVVEAVVAAYVGPTPATRQRLLVEAVREALGCLDADERSVVRMTYWGGESARSIGAKLNITHKTVGRRHERAIAKLRAYIQAELRGIAA